ncbi:MAG: copper-translocating P-type ATPase [Candidatus Sericytochromatia bacterium]|nr:MAG: copper-translocating P-type ATPase [Candidatus Sericytochromatia bacterium]
MNKIAAKETKCHHCSLNLPSKPIIKDNKFFCCNGCYIASKVINSNNNEIDLILENELNKIIKIDKSNINDLKETNVENFTIKGINCSSCVQIIEKVVNKQNGVIYCKVNPISNILKISYDNNYFFIDDLTKKLKKLGYILQKDNSDNKYFELEENYLIKLGLCWFLSMNIMALSFARYFGEIESHVLSTSFMIKMEAILSFVVTFVLGYQLIRNSLFKLKSFSFGMDFLVSFGSVTAYIYSLYSMYIGSENVYFDTSSMIISLVLLGKYLEALAKSKAGISIKRLIDTNDKKILVKKNGQEFYKYIDELQINDEIIVKKGEKFYVDGIIIEGESSVDESMLTGESIPINKKVNDKVFAGTINLENYLIVRVTEIGKETTIFKIINLIEKAYIEKNEFQKIADKVSQYFIPIVILLSLLTYSLWFNYSTSQAIIYAISVLVVACPCALGLATPMSTFIGLDKLAQKGIILKDSNLFEKLQKIDTIIFDKTGTITKGKLEVKKFINISKKYSDQDIFIFSKSLEILSEHPISKSICNYLSEIKLNKNVKNFKNFSGLGLYGEIEDKKIYIGSKNFLLENNFKINLEFQEALTQVYIFINNDLVGVFLLEDNLKDNAKETIQILSKKYDIYLLSGDNEYVVKYIANKLDIKKYEYNQLPEDKLRFIEKLKSENRNIIMIGDGINDAPALSKADIGISIINASDISKEVSDISMINSDIDKIPYLLDFSNKVINNLKINLFWAFSYNIVSIPLAMFGLLKPIFAALSMTISSLLIVNNSLRLK